MKIVGIEPKNLNTHVFSAFKLPRLAMPLLGTILNLILEFTECLQ